MIVLGVDIGRKGGLAVIKDGSLVSVEDMPLSGTDYDILAMAAFFRQYPTATVVYESVHAMKAQGVTSTFSLGRGRGIVEGLTTALCAKLAPVAPNQWKRHYPTLTGLERDKAKEKAVELAQSLEPTFEFARKKKRGLGSINLDGRAEAYLLARRHWELQVV